VTEKEKLEYLKTQGIDAALGMRYADDSLEFYEELIALFVQEYESKYLKVKTAGANPDREYTVMVHALKNNAKALGALFLAEIAYNHELASKAGKREEIRQNLQELLDAWEKTVQIFKQINN
jgi:HPt (histidine-containing phosphotransfer) domain-containing protein